MPDDQSEGLSEKEWFELPNWLFTQPYNARERNWGPWPDIPSSSPLTSTQPFWEQTLLKFPMPEGQQQWPKWLQSIMSHTTLDLLNMPQKPPPSPTGGAGEERPIPLDPEILNVSVPGADGELNNWEDFPLVT